MGEKTVKPRFNLFRGDAEMPETYTVKLWDKSSNVYYGTNNKGTVLGSLIEGKPYPVMEMLYPNKQTILYHLPYGSQRAAYKFTSALPQGTYLGDGTKTTWGQSYINAYNKAGKKGLIKQFFGKRIPIEGPYVGDEEAYSSDSYSNMLSFAYKNPDRFELRYTGDYMPWFNDDAMFTKAEIDEISRLPLQEKLAKVNEFITKFNPNAKKAFIQDNEVNIPHFFLITKK